MIQTSQENVFKLYVAYTASYISFQLNMTITAEKFMICNEAFRSILTTVHTNFSLEKKS